MEKKLIYNAEIVDLGLFIDGTLIISDLHIGYEQSLNQGGDYGSKISVQK